MTSSTAPVFRFEIGSCWRESAAIYRARIGTFAALSAMVSLLVMLPDLLFGIELPPDDQVPPAASIATALLLLVYQIVLVLVFSGIATLVAYDGRNGRFAHMPAYLGWVLPRLPGAFLVTGATLACILVGFLLFVVPGVWATVVLSVALPAFWVEDCGFRALGRSRQLVSGYGWPVLGFVLLASLTTGILSFALNFVPSFAFGFARGAQLLATPEPVEIFAWSFAAYLSALFTSVGSVVTYRRLVQIKQGGDADL